jgi:hypothetical protein
MLGDLSMSGGSMDYLCYKVSDAEFRESTPERKAFRAHLEKVSKALHDIEWVDSGDCSPGDENEAIRDCIGQPAVLAQLIEDSRNLIEKMQVEISKHEQEQEEK